MNRKSKRIFGLDVLRAIAILTVVYGHIFFIFPIIPDWTKPLVRLNIIDGVSIFFVLSGFLIGGILFSSLSNFPATVQNLLSFWRDRWLRTLPAYYFILGILIFSFESIHSFIPYLVFSQNLRYGRLQYFPESWSLAVEEWFYLTVPIMFFVGARFNLKKTAPIFILFVLVLSWSIRLFKIYHHHIDNLYDYSYIMMTVVNRVDSIMFGVLGAYLRFYQFKAWTNYRLPLFLTGLVGFLINHVYNCFAGLNEYVLVGQKEIELFCVLITLPYLSSIKTGHGILARAISFIAVISYSIYLVHLSIFLLIKPHLPSMMLWQILIYIVWSLGAAYILHVTIEKAGIRIREKLRKKRKMEAQLVPLDNRGNSRQ